MTSVPVPVPDPPFPVEVALSSPPTVPYQEIRDQLRTGDLVLFHSYTSAVSNVIKIAEKCVDKGHSEITHVGMVIRGESFCFPEGDPASVATRPAWLTDTGVYIFESTLSGHGEIPDVEGKSGFCAQLRDLDALVPNYLSFKGAKIYVAHLLDEHHHSDLDHSSAKIQEIYDRYRGLHYDSSLIDMASLVIPGLHYIRDNWIFRYIRDYIGSWIYGTMRSKSTDNPELLPRDNKISNWQFCSKMVASIYIDLGLFPKTVIPANVMPIDFLYPRRKMIIPPIWKPLVGIRAGENEPLVIHPSS